jgi:hypothetical protein
MKLQEIKTIEHKGIIVAIKVDYKTGTASIVTTEQYTPKKFVFAERGLEYMQGWLDIMEAMQEAAKECRRLLEENLEEKNQKLTEIVIQAYKEDAKNNKPKDCN